MHNAFGALAAPVWCTKIAVEAGAHLYRPARAEEPDCRSFWASTSRSSSRCSTGARVLTEAQQDYAACDVLYLHRLRDALDAGWRAKGRREMAQACFDFLPMRARLDLAGWPEIDIFAH